ncbi:hypothetical protein NG799_24080 [Laspinema sp. D1]|uniref:Uncharacterized protein n=1 Tax=Laspinema palackyanum D2a TaxID=2953684 RepID=A0ABT2MXB9_9CYAN|nr:hypothetical protein [Laspinema sp. D2a]
MGEESEPWVRSHHIPTPSTNPAADDDEARRWRTLNLLQLAQSTSFINIQEKNTSTQ